ncbi:MAG: hypothetical protein FWE34_08330 [Defluviitaleaceae bacterium]|nr:hypothetical protein [Defluviitaleaceae bacterium]
MFFKKKRVVCKTAVVLAAIAEAMDLGDEYFDIEILYDEQKHRIGFFGGNFYVDEYEFNGFEHFKEEAVLGDHLLAQNFDDIEILMVDGKKPHGHYVFADFVVRR